MRLLNTQSRFCIFVFVVSCFTALSAQAQLNWGGGIQSPGVSNIGGGSTQRPTVSSAVFNNEIYVAYTSNVNCSASQACNVMLASSSVQQDNGSFLFNAPVDVYVPDVGTVTSSSNPSIAVYGSYAYLAWTGPGGNNYVSESTDMVNWSYPLSIPASPTVTSMDMVYQPENGSLWIAYMQGQSQSGSYHPVICQVNQNNSNFQSSAVSCNTINFMSPVNFNPSLTWDNDNNLYAFMAYRGSSHCLNSYINNYGGDPQQWAYYNPNRLCHEQQTSSAPSSTFYYDGSLYVGYRANDSSDRFDYVVINTAASTWVHYSSNDSMDGGPSLLGVSTNDGLSLLQPEELINFYSSGGNLYSDYGY